MSTYETPLHSLDPTMLQRPQRAPSSSGSGKKKRFGRGGGPKPPRPPKPEPKNHEVDHDTLLDRSKMPYDLVSSTNLQLFTRNPITNYSNALQELAGHPVTVARKHHRHMVRKGTGALISRKTETFLNVYNKRMGWYVGALALALAAGGAADRHVSHSAKKSGSDVAASAPAPNNSMFISALVAHETSFNDAANHPMACAKVGVVALRAGETIQQAEAAASLAPESSTPATLAANPNFIAGIVALDKNHVGPFRTPAAPNTATVLVSCGPTA